MNGFFICYVISQVDAKPCFLQSTNVLASKTGGPILKQQLDSGWYMWSGFVSSINK